MCLLLMGLHAHPRYKLILAANRDEYYDRPTAKAGFWDKSPNILGGRDLRGGGTWLGITREGRLAAITNYRDPASNRTDAPSRGELVSGFLLSNVPPQEYLSRLAAKADQYNGFNLVVGFGDQYYWYSNRGGDPRLLTPGIYGICNHLLDTPWPKVKKAKEGFRKVLSHAQSPEPEAFFQILSDGSIPPDVDLPHTGMGLEWERILAPVFVKSDIYGTRSSTVLLVGQKNNVTLIERTFHKHSGPHHTDAKYFFPVLP